jgi:hypothetical protein
MMSGIGIPTSQRRMGMVFPPSELQLASVAVFPCSIAKTAAFGRGQT